MTRKPQRPRVDLVCRLIESGDYDDVISRFQEAIANRQELRRKTVLKLVEQVYGPGHIVAPYREARGVPVPSATLSAEEPGPDSLSETVQQPFRGEDEPLTQDQESRSPIFGGLPDLGQPIPEPESERTDPHEQPPHESP